jgi:hypothetical protein
MKEMQKIATLWLSWIVIVGGCATHHKTPPTEMQYATLIVGKTTYSEALDLLGEPMSHTERDKKLTATWEWSSDSNVDLKRYIPIVGPVIADKKTSYWSETIKLEFDASKTLLDVQRETDFRPTIQ